MSSSAGPFSVCETRKRWEPGLILIASGCRASNCQVQSPFDRESPVGTNSPCHLSAMIAHAMIAHAMIAHAMIAHEREVHANSDGFV